MSRVFAILSENPGLKANVEKLVKAFAAKADKVIVFSVDNAAFEGADVVQIPAEADTRPKRKNFVVHHFKDSGFDGFLHQIEDCVDIISDPSKFIDDIEKLMSILDVHNWCGTVTDTCNYVYDKYNPRLDVVLDKPEYASWGLDVVRFCSHSNVQWIVYDMKNADDNELYFNDSFKVDMFWIIEFLARRRNSHPGSLYYMNQYYTCASEYGVYKRIACDDDAVQDTPQQMRAEDALFKSMNVNYMPDNNIDLVLETLYEKLKTKCSA